jgi:hypothetical protein
MDSNDKRWITKYPIFHIALGVSIVTLGTWEIHILNSQGSSGLLRLTIGIVLILLIAVFLQIMIKKFMSKNKSKLEQHTPPATKPEITIKYIEYKGFRWQVNIIDGKYKISETPICPNCCVPLIKQENEWDGYDFNCLNCKTPFKEYDFINHHKSIVNILNTPNGINRFTNIFDDPC